MPKTMLALRKTPAGEEYYEVGNERGAVLATKNHQGGLDDQDDKSNGKIFQRPGSKRFPVKLISKYLRHLNPESSNLFQRPRSPCKSFNPAKDEVWFCSVPLGHNSLEGKVQNVDPWSMDRVHQNMDRVHGPLSWTGSMYPLFLLPLKLLK